MNNNETQLCSVVELVTPKKVRLNGLWFGPYSAKATKGKPTKSKRVFVWVHGLGSSLFSKTAIMEKLVDRETAVLAFNNRGHDVISGISLTNKSGKRKMGGAAHEIFTDCVDDIQGAVNFGRRQGAKEIYLIGHSTGCQKSVYWAARGGRGVKGIVLMAPISDYAAEVHLRGKARVTRVLKIARALVAQGKKHALLPEGAWHETLDAQRFVSLYSGGGPEEIFSYWSSKISPKALRHVKVPLLVLLAEKDEYSDRPASEMAAWFGTHTKKHDRVEVVEGVEHGFRGGEDQVAVNILMFVRRR